MPSSLLLIELFILGLTGGCLSGLLGIGGGIVMLPLLLSLPYPAGYMIGLREAVGITMLQSLTGSISGVLVHRRYDAFNPRLAVTAGGSAAVGSFVGAALSSMMSERVIATLFVIMTVTSLVFLLLPEPQPTIETVAPTRKMPAAAIILGCGVGFLAGIVGQGGAFIILPLLIHALKVPARTAIGTTAGVALLSALAGFLGKWETGQVPLFWGVAVSCGALLGGQAGGMLSHRLSTVTLRRVLIFVVVISAARIFVQTLS